jgi:hypothetical protein
VLEHKTSSEDVTPGSFYWMRRHMDGQVSIYFDGARAAGHDVQGCIYDVLASRTCGRRTCRSSTRKASRSSTTRPATGCARRTARSGARPPTPSSATSLQVRPETPLEFRDRIVDKIAEDVEAFYQRGDVARDGQDLVEAARDRWQLGTMLRDAIRTDTWPRNPDACMRFNRPCEFLEACAGRADLTDRYLFQRAESAHPELSERDLVPLRTSATRLLTSSALSTARACLRLYRNRYVLQLRSLTQRDEAPELGDLVHVGLEAWWLYREPATTTAALTTSSREETAA